MCVHLSEMTCDCRAVLGMCCSHSVLNTMELLVSKGKMKTTRYTSDASSLQLHVKLCPPPVPGSVCVRKRRAASEQHTPDCTDRGRVWKDCTSVRLLQHEPGEGRGHGEDRNKPGVGEPSPGPVHRCQGSGLINSGSLNWRCLQIHQKLLLTKPAWRTQDHIHEVLFISVL